MQYAEMYCSWRKKNNPTHINWLTAGRRGDILPVLFPTPSHPFLSLSTSSTISVLKQIIRNCFTDNHPNYPSLLSSDCEQPKEFLCPLPAKLPLFMPNAKMLLQSPQAEATGPIPDTERSAVHPISVLDKSYPMSGALKPCYPKLPSIML